MRTELPIVSFICTVLMLILLPWNWRARNVTTLSLIFWLTLCNVTRGINAIVWGGSTVVKYRVWGDITTKLIIGAYVALPASMLCLCRYLSQIASPRRTLADRSEKRRRMILELVMCFGLPIIGMALHYVVQGHRFDIIEDFGPNPVIYSSIAALFLVYLPPMVLSLGTLIYAGIALRWFVHRRVQFRTTLQSSQSGLTVDHYFRLIALSITEMVYMLSMCVFIAYTNLQQYGFRPWVSWDYVHEDWFRIVQYSKVLVPNFFWDYYLPIWYIIPLTSMIFFAFFGFGREANAEYAKWFQWIRTCVFRMKSNAAPVLPISVRGGTAANLRGNTQVMVKLQTETGVPEQDKSIDVPGFNHSTLSQPASSSDDPDKVTLNSPTHA